ncbi:MAG: radical SAM protein, partial [Desulfobacterales bacterium]
MNIWVLNPPFLPKFSRPQRSPAVTKSGTIYFPIWLAYCVGVLENEGYAVTFTDAPASGDDLDRILQQAENLKPDLIVMDTSTPSIENDIHVGDRLKQLLPESFIVMVGTHVSALAEETLLRSNSIDAVARREYEYTIRDLANFLHKTASDRNKTDGLESIAGLSFISNGNVVHNPERKFIRDLDELPWASKIYKKHLRIRDYFNPNAPYPMVTMTTSRGCPFRCSFCVYPQTFTGRRFRFRSINEVLDEMEFVLEAFPEVKSIFFEDDTLTANRNRCLELAQAIIDRGLQIPWVANSRIDLDLDTLVKLKAAGCRELCVGFESGDQELLDSMGKGIKLDHM